MRVLIIAAVAFAVATPAQALPIWAEAVAQSECEYYAMGVGFPEALQQALRDNNHWNDEIKQAGPKVAAKAIMAATYIRCQKLQRAAYDAANGDEI